MANIRRTKSYSSDDGGGSSGCRGKTYMCKVCGQEFGSGQSLGGHMNVHRREQRSPRRGQEAPSGDAHHNYKGVRYRSEQMKWVAEIRPPKASSTWWLGTYSSAREAAYAYDVAITYFRSETALNFSGHPVYNEIPQIDPDLPKQEYAAALRSVVKTYSKRAMDSGAGASSSSSNPPPEFCFEDFPPYPPPPPPEYNENDQFTVYDMPQPDPPEYQQHLHDAQAGSYYGYQHGPFGPYDPHNPRGY